MILLGIKKGHATQTRERKMTRPQIFTSRGLHVLILFNGCG